MSGQMGYIRKMYAVPAKRGGRVIYTGGVKDRKGTIISARNAHLRIRMDDNNTIILCHPTWKMEYL